MKPLHFDPAQVRHDTRYGFGSSLSSVSFKLCLPHDIFDVT